MNTETVFLEPLDVLFLRGNKLFGDAGSFGESLVPPWPSVAAGALRSRLLADAGVELASFADGKVDHPELGTPNAPGPFTVTAFHLARRLADGSVERLLPPPADLVIGKGDAGHPQVRTLSPTSLAKPGPICSAPLPLLPVLAEDTRSKPEGGCWLTEAGWQAYLGGETPGPGQFIDSAALWSIDTRVGVGLDAATRRADDGRLFTVQAVAMSPGVGFLATARGGSLPQNGTVRLGGDGRAAAVHPVSAQWPEPEYEAIVRSGRCRLVLTAPGLFNRGWLPNGVSRADDGSLRFDLCDVRGRLVCAAVPRAETVSGWDLAQRRPKPARRVAPTGSVYWLDELEGSPEALRKLVEHGLWSQPCQDVARRAEGFNRITFAAY